MSTALVAITASMVGPGGEKLQGVRITATLSAPVVVADLVLPQSETATTDANGQATLSLYPNSISSPKVTTYTFEIRPPGAIRSLFFYDVVVPESSTAITLSQLLGYANADITLDFWNGDAHWTGTYFWG